MTKDQEKKSAPIRSHGNANPKLLRALGSVVSEQSTDSERRQQQSRTCEGDQ